jgi:uncharacterized membrane protein YhhN
MEIKNLTNWHSVGIGVSTGILATLVVLALTNQMNLFDNQGRLAFAGWEILLSIVGAMIGKSKRKTWRGIWIGAIIGSLSPGVLAIIWILFVVLIAGSLGG